MSLLFNELATAVVHRLLLLAAVAVVFAASAVAALAVLAALTPKVNVVTQAIAGLSVCH
jgi:hypothetical protein